MFQPGADLEISVAELSARLGAESAEPCVLLDVRTPAEVAIVCFEAATLIPLHELVARYAAELDPASEIVCYCHHGMRSLQATMFLRQQGFERICSLRGGIDAWALEADPSMARY